MLILYNFTQTQKYFTLALLVLLVTNIMSGGQPNLEHLQKSLCQIVP